MTARSRLRAGLGAALALFACTGDTSKSSISAPADGPLSARLPRGTVFVTTVTTGSNLDADGYTVTLDAGSGKSGSPTIGINATLKFPNTNAGERTVTLSGLAANCTTTGNPRIFVLSEGASVTITFNVTCTAVVTTGTLIVNSATTGSDLDPDGYTVSVDDGPGQPIGPNGSITIPDLTAGQHTVLLTGLANNCNTTNNPRSVDVTAGASASVSFDVACAALVTTGTLVVNSGTTGSDLDPDGYSVAVDGGDGQPIGLDGSVTFANLGAGEHTVLLAGLAANCTTTGNPRAVAIAAGATTTVTFDVACAAIVTTGTLVVSTTTTGSDPDADGYAVALDGGAGQPIGTSGSVTFSNVGAGQHTVALAGLASNCTTTNNPRSVDVAAGATASVTFAIACTEIVTTGDLVVNSATSGSNLDPDGYLVAVDGGAGQALGINGSLMFSGLGAGQHTVLLSGLASNCTTTDNPRSVSITAGATATIGFAVTCTAPPPPPPPSSFVLLTAGDIAGCDFDGDEMVARVIDGVVATNPDATVLTLGDNAYLNGSAAEYANCYHPTWGRHKARTYATLGNHDYQSVKDIGDATPTWDYFGDRAGPRGLGYYTFDLGEWHIIVLSDNSYYGGPGDWAGSRQDQWLQADLAANTKQCTIAVWHQPYISSGDWTNASRKWIWDRLYAAGVEIILNGHKHHYERMAPQRPDLVRDDAKGLRSFIVATGGSEVRMPTPPRPNTEALSATNGVLKLTLSSGSYAWEFLPVQGQTFTDSGSGTCH